jgi:pentatricopeptide repeat protein
MYARNGLLCDARLLFNKIKCRDVVSWNSLMNGYAQLEESNNAVGVFNRMRGEGMEPDAVTFIILLNMCARAQMIDRSQTFFGAMSEGYGVSPMLGHYSCMADALGHAGQIDEAIAIVTVTDMQRPHLVGWRKILRACKYLGNSGLARLAFQQHGSL